MSQYVVGKVIGQKEWAPGLFSLYVKASLPQFIAGQFIQIGLPSNGEHLFRPYSFANAPHEDTLEFYYDIINSGKLTPSLSQLKPKDELLLSAKAVGRFVLSAVPSAPILWLIATGTGLGVFLSMLKTLEPWEKFNQIVLVHSVRYHSGLTHGELIDTWQKNYPSRFHYLPIVTRECIENYFSKRIPELLKNNLLEERLKLSLSKASSQVMLCGNPGMVKEMSALLGSRGLEMNRLHHKGQITVESYWKD